jgi:hypothetical protein
MESSSELPQSFKHGKATRQIKKVKISHNTNLPREFDSAKRIQVKLKACCYADANCFIVRENQIHSMNCNFRFARYVLSDLIFKALITKNQDILTLDRKQGKILGDRVIKGEQRHQFHHLFISFSYFLYYWNYV